MEPVRKVLVNDDGTIDPDQLEGLPPEMAQQLIDKLAEMQKSGGTLRIPHARTGRRESRRQPLRMFHVEQFKNDQARNIGKPQKPKGTSGRQWRQARKLANKIGRATISREGGN